MEADSTIHPRNIKPEAIRAFHLQSQVLAARRCAMIQVVKKVRDDANVIVRQRVTDALQSQNFPAFRNFEIEVDRGVLTVTGVVQSFYRKQIAMTLCRNVPGVSKLVDKIRVRRIWNSDPGRFNQQSARRLCG